MTRLPRFYVYLLIAREDGMIYTGYTSNLQQRFKQHNATTNTGFTRGRAWHLLAVKCFLDSDTALLFEQQLKRSKFDKRNWIKRAAKVSTRLKKLRSRYGIHRSSFG